MRKVVAWGVKALVHSSDGYRIRQWSGSRGADWPHRSGLNRTTKTAFLWQRYNVLLHTNTSRTSRISHAVLDTRPAWREASQHNHTQARKKDI